MMQILDSILPRLLDSLRDVGPIIFILLGFQWLILKKPIPHLKKICVGFLLVLIGIIFFLVGLETTLFPLGKLMAQQLTDPAFIHPDTATAQSFWDYKWIYLFAFAIGFSTTIAEPALLAVAIKAKQVSGGGIHSGELRIAVALGVAIGITLGTYRIISGTPLYWYIMAAYLVVILQTIAAPRMIIALAYDAGGVTTSTVTVPLVAALGIGLASSVPGRDIIVDGFGLIAFASVFPIISVLAYATIVMWIKKSLQSNHT